MNLSPLLDGNNGGLSMTLGLGDPLTGTYLMGESALILGRDILKQKETLFAGSGTLSPTTPVFAPPAVSPGGGGDGPGDGGPGDSGDGPGSGNDGGDNGAGDG